MARPYAVFDIDGTLIRWQLYHAIADELARQGLIQPQDFERARAARRDWKIRVNDQSFSEYEQTLIKVFDESLVGLSVERFMAAAESVFDEYREQVYTYTRDLITKLKEQDYLLFAISGSPDVIVKKMATFYGFDDYKATVFHSENGKFIGSKDLSLGKKHELMMELVEKHGAEQKGSVAVGDSESDVEVLSHVERAIAFNPSKQLFNQALKDKWEIVVERKNVIYQLEVKDGRYQLKV